MDNNAMNAALDLVARIAAEARTLPVGERLALLTKTVSARTMGVAAEAVCARLNSELPRCGRTHYEVQKKYGVVAIAHVQE